MSKEELKVGDKMSSNGDAIEITQEMLDYYKRCKTTRIIIDTSSLHDFYRSRHDGDYHNEIWDCICDSFAYGRLAGFSFKKEPKNKAEELINEFIEAHPELGSTVWFYFSD